MNETTRDYDDEIDLVELASVLWRNKFLIVKITLTAAIISIIFAMMQPNIYESKALLAPAASDGSSSMSKLAGQFGGLASLAGVSLSGGGGDRTAYAIGVVKSRKFVSAFVDRHKLKAEFLAVSAWDRDAAALVFDDDLYDAEKKTWFEEPTDQTVYDAYMAALSINEDGESGFITIGFRHLSPEIAQKWTALAVADLNSTIRNQDIAEAEQSISYLQQQIRGTSLSELKMAFYDLIQAQTETMMLAQVREEYVFKTVDPSFVPENKSEPKRALICILGTLLGGFLSVLIVLVRHYWVSRNAVARA
jgi:uncharacterized protein involved in exopolysaccharide biosynthesis